MALDYRQRFIGAILYQVRRGTVLPWLEDARGIAGRARDEGRLGELMDAMTPRQQRVLSEFLLGDGNRYVRPPSMNPRSFEGVLAEVKLKLARWELGEPLVRKGKTPGTPNTRAGHVVRELQWILSSAEDRRRLLPALTEKERMVVERRLASPKESLADAAGALGISVPYVAMLQKRSLEKLRQVRPDG